VSVKQERAEYEEEEELHEGGAEEVASDSEGEQCDSNNSKDGGAEEREAEDLETEENEAEERGSQKTAEYEPELEEERDGGRTPTKEVGANGVAVEDDEEHADSIADLPGAMIERLLFGDHPE
jgi:hypothetical protein